jgi:hypothetical protein
MISSSNALRRESLWLARDMARIVALQTGARIKIAAKGLRE